MKFISVLIICSLTFFLSLFLRNKFSSSQYNRNDQVFKTHTKTSETVSEKSFADHSTMQNKNSEMLLNDNRDIFQRKKHTKRNLVSNNQPNTNLNRDKFESNQQVPMEIKKLTSEIQHKNFDVIAGTILEKKYGLPPKKVKSFNQIKQDYRNIKVDEEFDQFIISKYGTRNIVQHSQEWENFQRFIHQKYEKELINTIGSYYYQIYSGIKSKGMDEGKSLTYPHLLPL